MEAEVDRLSDPVEVYDDEVSKEVLLNLIESEIKNNGELATVSKEAMEEHAIENSILDKAFENAKEILKLSVYLKMSLKLYKWGFSDKILKLTF